ncbi:dimethylhistidine N-methyltransferase [Stella humosa]|uniref:Dimethylhistidine N-methyltransferase n=1 Tax=Stella humosa TaxID=94 RepID=A0A3N1L1E3_9PROT|nr:L-histidine N(alpha)-methyltransferase [Stella humosa]ROP83345.1 dimethylhistidine N-methyltransferase [Stella humosa]BBK29871.1 dimethylhistidine N-methyltransferase [Stella humosa]
MARTEPLRLHDLEPSTEEFRQAVIDGLSGQPKTLPCKFFYDAEGSRLFDAICELPEYYPTRTELGILSRNAPAMAAAIGPDARIVEFGSGAGVKIRLLLAALERPAAYVPVDICREHMMAAADGLAADFPDLRIAPVCADYTRPFALPSIPGADTGVTVGFFPGSTIGNFSPAEATAFLARARRLLGRGSMMLVGADVPKDAGVLEAAYDDAAGVTAAFNRNLLVRMQRELGAELDIELFRHEARWCPRNRRVEMHLVSLSRQEIRLGDRVFAFDRGESIHTENSYKYSVPEFRALAGRSGWLPAQTWTDAAGLFAVHLLRSG